MMWLDFFLQALVEAFAWSLAAAPVAGLFVWIWWRADQADKDRRAAEARAWLNTHLGGRT